jgi:hypothetical protein
MRRDEILADIGEADSVEGDSLTSPNRTDLVQWTPSITARAV